MVTVRGKERRVGRKAVVGSSWKKAVVTLKPGDKIQIFEGV
jgi:large subunit ribosomal protein L23